MIEELGILGAHKLWNSKHIIIIFDNVIYVLDHFKFIVIFYDSMSIVILDVKVTWLFQKPWTLYY